MFRASTPLQEFIFETELDPEETFEKILITYTQNNRIVLEKKKEDLSFEEADWTDCAGNERHGWIASFRLTQEETNSFSSSGVVKIQVRGKTYDGEVIPSDKMTVTVEDVLNDEVL